MALLFVKINRHAGTPKYNNYKRHDKLGGYDSICYIGSKIGWVSMKDKSTSYRDIEVIMKNLPTVLLYGTYFPIALVVVFVIHAIYILHLRKGIVSSTYMSFIGVILGIK